MTWKCELLLLYCVCVSTFRQNASPDFILLNLTAKVSPLDCHFTCARVDSRISNLSRTRHFLLSNFFAESHVVSGSEERKEYYPAQVPPPQLPKIKKDVVLVSSLRSRSPPPLFKVLSWAPCFDKNKQNKKRTSRRID